MENYNPRQITRMRWKDTRELEKFSFLYGDFDIQAEQLENVSQDENWSKVANLFKNYDNTNNKKGIILYDYLQNFLCTGYLTGQYLYLYSVSETGVTYITIDYDIKIDSMRIYVEDETFISEDHVKTIFGQSISGTGDIGLYMHVLGLIKSKAEYGDTEYKILVTYYSSNKLKVDSLQDLTALTNASSTNKVILTGIAFYNAESGNPANTIYNDYCGVQFDGTNWRFRQITDTNTPTGALITEVSDIVTPI